MNGTFYPSILVSTLAHAMLLAVILVFAGKPNQKAAYPEVYRVNISAIRPSGPKPSATRRTAPKKIAAPPAQETAKSTRGAEPKTGTVMTEKARKNERLRKVRSQKKEKSPKKPDQETTKGTGSTSEEPSNELEGVEFGDGLSGIIIEGEGFEDPSYINIVFAKIRSRWDARYGPDRVVSVVVYFRIGKDGSVGELSVEEPSGVPSFDRAAIRAVDYASPLPPLPSDYRGDWLGIHLKFTNIPEQ